MKKSASYYFWLTVFSGGIFLALFLVVFWNAMPFAAAGYHSFLGHVRDFCEGLGKVSELTLYGITIGFFISCSLVAFALIKTAVSALKTTALRRRYEYEQIFDKKFLSAARRTGLKTGEIKIINGDFLPFCAGLFRPKIFISKEFVKNLNTQELTAVLLHEKQHLKSFDILKIFVVRFFSSFFFFAPFFRILEQKYNLYSELEADARASAGFQHKAPLLSAIRKIYKNSFACVRTPGIATALDMRLGFLLSIKEFPSIAISKKQIFFSIFCLAFFAAIFLGSFHFNHALSVEVVKYYEGQMTPVAWNQISFFNSSNLYLTPINQTKNITQCWGEAVNFSHL